MSVVHALLSLHKAVIWAADFGTTTQPTLTLQNAVMQMSDVVQATGVYVQMPVPTLQLSLVQRLLSLHTPQAGPEVGAEEVVGAVVAAAEVTDTVVGAGTVVGATVVTGTVVVDAAALVVPWKKHKKSKTKINK